MRLDELKLMYDRVCDRLPDGADVKIENRLSFDGDRGGQEETYIHVYYNGEFYCESKPLDESLELINRKIMHHQKFRAFVAEQKKLEAEAMEEINRCETDA